jgi:hypothetical protein
MNGYLWFENGEEERREYFKEVVPICCCLPPFLFVESCDSVPFSLNSFLFLFSLSRTFLSSSGDFGVVEYSVMLNLVENDEFETDLMK